MPDDSSVHFSSLRLDAYERSCVLVCVFCKYLPPFVNRNWARCVERPCLF